jgi:hypothetical protein
MLQGHGKRDSNFLVHVARYGMVRGGKGVWVIYKVTSACVVYTSLCECMPLNLNTSSM